MSDNGSEFKNRVIEAFCNENEIKWKYSSPYHPQTNGVVERFNGTIIRKLRAIILFGKLQWDKHLDKALSGYHNSFMRAINMTPREFIEGKTTIYPIDIKLGIQKLGCNFPRDKLVKDISKHRLSYQKEYSSGNEIKNKFSIGDEVLFYNQPKQKTKLETKWERGYKIIGEKTRSYILQDKQGRKIRASEEHLRRGGVLALKRE
ncbi:MAG: integrase core domain-containing protein [Aeromonas sp.]